MELLHLFFLSLAVGLATAIDPRQYDLEEYRLAAKRYHRKIRSSQTQEVIVQLPPPQIDTNIQKSTIKGKVEDESSQLSVVTNNNTSNNPAAFLLDLPYPSHFLLSLQLLNVSLPFLDESVASTIPEDPPTPQFELGQVINNNQFAVTTGEPVIIHPAAGLRVEHHGGRKVVRSRNRIPPAQYRRPTRSVSELTTDSTNEEVLSTTTATPALTLSTLAQPIIKSRTAIGSNHTQRRLEIYTKNRPTTTPRPAKPIKKFQPKALLDRRANATKTYVQHRSPIRPPIKTTTAEAITEEPIVESTTENPLTSTEQHQIIIDRSSDFDSQRVQMAGFLPNRLGSSSSDSYLSQFHSQIQKPLTSPAIDLNEETSSSSEAVLLSVTPSSPILNLSSYAPYDLAASATLPPPLSIEELIKKFTGSEPITDSPSSSPTIATPSISTTTTERPEKVVDSDDEELQQLDELELSLKKLFAVTISSDKINPPVTTTAPITTTTTPAPAALVVLASSEDPEPTTYKPESTHQNQQSIQRGPLDVSSGGDGGNGNFVDGSFSAGFSQAGFQPGAQTSFNFQPNFQQHQPTGHFGGGGGYGGGGGGFGGGDLTFGGAVQQTNPYFFGSGLSGPSGQSGNGFDGLLHYSPTGPLASNEFNPVIQGLSLLASFGGGAGGGGNQQAGDPQHQQQQFIGSPVDFNSAGQQSFGVQPSQFQLSPSFGGQFPSIQPQFSQFQQGYPSFPQQFQLPQQFPSSFQQFQPAQQHQPPSSSTQQFQPVQQHPSSVQQFQTVQQHPSSFQQFQPVQQGQQVALFQQSHQTPHQQVQQVSGINPAQFGSLLAIPGTTSGAATETEGSLSGDKTERSGSASQLIETLLQSKLSSRNRSPPAEEEEISATEAPPIELIPIGTQAPPIHSKDSHISDRHLVKKSLYARGLHSGYYP